MKWLIPILSLFLAGCGVLEGIVPVPIPGGGGATEANLPPDVMSTGFSMIEPWLAAIPGGGVIALMVRNYLSTRARKKRWASLEGKDTSVPSHVVNVYVNDKKVEVDDGQST